MKLPDNPVLMSFSGGQSSALLGTMVIEKYYNRIGKDIHFFFGDTGAEHEKTYQFISDFESYFNIKVHKEKKDIIELIEKTGYLPNRMMRFCSSRIKERPAKKFMQGLGYEEHETLLGIRFDEPLRVARMKDRYLMPLHDARITKADVNNYWDMMPFKLEIPNYKGNCKFCFMKAPNKLIALAKEYPEEFERWAKLEEKLKRGKNGFRTDLSFRQILEMSERPTLFDFIDAPNTEISCGCTD